MRDVLKAYDSVEKAIAENQQELLDQIQEAESQGETISPSWLVEQKRYSDLLDQIHKAAADLSGASSSLTTAQEGAVLFGAATAERLTYIAAGGESVARAAGIVFNRLPQEQLLAAVGTTADGSPLSTLFQDLAGDRADQVRQTLLAGIGSGSSSTQIAKDLQTVADISRARAATIARTELHRAARVATIDSYRASGVVEGWYWVAACDRRTCAACWAMQGTLHPNDEEFGSHPSCRCYASPALKDFRTSPDQPDVRPVPATGADKFAALTEAEQREILGPTLYKQYADGDLDLSDMVHETSDPKWGTTRNAASIAQAAINAANRQTGK